MKIKNIYVELKKIYKKNSFKIFITSIILLTILLTIYVKNTNSSKIPFVNKELSNNSNYIKQYNKYNKLYEESILINDYITENNIDTYSPIKNQFKTSYIILIIVSLYIISISSKSIGYEYEIKTIKNMLIKNKKSDIIFSKLISLIIISFIIYLLVYLTNMITISIYNNYNVFDLTNIVYKNAKFIKESFIIKHTCEYFMYFIPNIMVICLSLFISLLFKSSIIATIVSMFLTISSSFITDLMLGLNIKLISYTFLPYMDYSIFSNMENIYLYNMENGINLDPSIGVVILFITSLICIVSSLIIIYKREYK